MAAVASVSGHEPPHALQQIPGGYAARSTRMSISLRSVLKSIGLVSSASAPFALRAGSDRDYVARPRREPCPVHAPGTASWW